MASVANRGLILLAQCVPSLKHNASRFKVKRLELDQNLLMVSPKIRFTNTRSNLTAFPQYFSNFEFLYAHDPERKCKTGDIVLIEQLPQKMSRLITHKVKEIIYPMGDITDPITGKKVIWTKYRDEIEAVNDVYGKLPSAFDYDSAPQRGWQEDKKDFTHVETYVKYHVFDDDDQPYAV